MSRPVWQRRDVLKAGAIGASLTLSRYLNWVAAGEVAESTQRSGILVFLRGGPSHQDTFDLKPDSPSEVRGDFRPRQTKVPGIEICEHLPRLAAVTDRYAIIRNLSHNLAAHDLGTRYVLTGNRPIPLLRFPSLGSVASRELPCRPDVPAYVAIDEDPEGPGYLGVQHGALATGEMPRYGQPFSVRGITLDDGLSIDKFARRRRLSQDLDAVFGQYDEQDRRLGGATRLSERAFQIISSPQTRAAFDVEREAPAVVQNFGQHEFGMSLLVAARLIEAGVRFVTVMLEGWDTHQKNFDELKNRLLPPLDAGLAALLQTLEDKGLFESTSLLVTGEFGRTPKINGNAGRDHWAQAMFALLAGGGIRGGQVIGATDATAAAPDGQAYSPDDLAATFYRSLGIDPHKEYHTESGRPILLVRDGRPIEAVFTG
jgi:hypothetical protein